MYTLKSSVFIPLVLFFHSVFVILFKFIFIYVRVLNLTSKNCWDWARRGFRGFPRYGVSCVDLCREGACSSHYILKGLHDSKTFTQSGFDMFSFLCISTSLLIFYYFVLLFFLRHGLILFPRLASNSWD
jgi:hypothetical protein